MSLADIKAKARRAIHRSLAVPALLRDAAHPQGLIFGDDYSGPGLLVRYHNKIDQTGGLDASYGEIIDGIDRMVFLDENIAEVSAALLANGEEPLALSRDATVTIPAYKGLRFTLDTREPPDGPAETIWVVARTRV